MLQTWIGLSLVGVPLMLGLWLFWWSENEAARFIVAIVIWGAFTWREVVMLAPWYDRLDSNIVGVVFLALLYANGWLATLVSRLPKYWRAQRVSRRSWQAELYGSFARLR